MTIRVLDSSLASKIAAGEVIERPASVVKELVENALDAGARSIQVELRGGGIQQIRVSDDGCGISEDELELAFERHATSKLESLDDLDAIATLGFRGEALPSVRSVAEVSILSRPVDQEFAGFRRFQGGQVAERGRRGAAPGTQITVRNLFGSVPARLRFLRSPATETAQAVNVVVQYALAFPEVRFSVDVDGRNTFRSPGTGTLREAVLAAYGREVSDAMIAVDSTDDPPMAADRAVQVVGLVGRPSVNRGNRAGISLFVNRRWVQSRQISQAVENAYQNLMMVGRHPLAVLHLTVPASAIDINVHPTKSEIRLIFDREAFSVVHRSIRNALLRELPVPAMSPIGTPVDVIAPQSGDQLAFPEGEEPTRPVSRTMPVLRVVGQVGLTYVITEGPDGMYLVDQHAAHERVLFDRLLADWDAGRIESQGLLEPLTVELTAEQREAFERQGDRLLALGFQIEPFGDRSVAVRAAPAIVAGPRLGDAVTEAIQTLGVASIDWRSPVAATIACHAAVRAGQTLSDAEMRELIRLLEDTNSPRTCPHGRPTMLHLSASLLEREFGRRG